MTGTSRRKEIIATGLAVLVLAAAVVTGTLVQAKSPPSGMTAMAGNFHIQDAWARINPVAGRPSAAYVTIHYGGTKPDMLVAASTPVAGRVELHNHLMDKGVMRMVKVSSIVIPPDSETILKPSGYHLMLFDMKNLPKAGARVPLTLTFKSGTTLTVMMMAQGLTAGGPDGSPAAAGKAADHHGHHGHHGHH
jgi:periplasmic copper chaperone A